MGAKGEIGGAWIWGSIVLVVAGNVLYHLGQRAVPRGVHPLAAVLAMYIVAAAGTLALWPLFGRGASLGRDLAASNWAVAACGLAIVGIELGFLVAYRAGWRISVASVTANIIVALSLLAVGALAFREPLTVQRVAGAGLALVGLWLLNRG